MLHFAIAIHPSEIRTNTKHNIHLEFKQDQKLNETFEFGDLTEISKTF